MTQEVLVDSQQNTLVDTAEVFYTAPSGGTNDKGVEIKAFTATNNTVSNKTYTAYIYRITDVTEAIVPRKILVRDQFDMAPGIIGQKLNPGDQLRMESSAANSIVFRVTGTTL